MAVDVISNDQLVKLSERVSSTANSSSGAADDQFTSRIYLGVNAFRDLASDNAAIDKFAPSPMQSYLWNLSAAESFTDGEPVLVTVQRQGKTVAFAPLFRPYGEERLLFLGHNLYEPTLMAYADDAACHALARALMSIKEPIFLRDMDASSSIVQALQQACGETNRFCITRPMPAHPWLTLDESWARPEEHLNSGRRSDLRRARRNLEKMGALSFLNIVPTMADLDDVLAEVFRVESANWKGEEGSGLAYDPTTQTFFRRYAQLACEQGILRILLMKCGDKTAAVQYAVEYKNRFWLLKMGYDQAYARCSPGELLIVESMRLAAERGLEAYEFMGTCEAWTHKWTEQSHASVSMRIYAPGLRGLAGIAAESAGAAARRAGKMLFKKKVSNGQ
jgi:CelD/BcsL family acetyltransferase involved in cellulose biosynthesis